MSIIDKVLERYKPKAETYTVRLPGGEEFEFRHFKDADDFEAFTDCARQYVSMATPDASGKKTAVHPSMKAVLPKNPKTIISAIMIHWLAVGPKITEIEAFKLAQIHAIFVNIVNAIEIERQKFEAAEIEEAVEGAKKDLKQTATGETS